MTRTTRISRASRAVCAAVVCLTCGDLARAQQASTPRTPPPPTPVATAPVDVPVHRGGSAAMPQGFSVVLVQGELQTVSATDDVPPAARKALADMRDFLPYKSYKLLDAAWVLCCGLRSADAVVTQLRGPEDREYELSLSASAAPSDPRDARRVAVQFTLRDVTAPAPGVKPLKDDDPAVNELKVKIAQAEAELSNLRQKYNGQSPQVRRAETELAGMRRRLDAMERKDGPMVAARRMAGRGVIDTSFSMDVGETVVVGTSRLRGGSRALIALLTAVPPKGMTERKE
jgi:hypothetical protein